MGAIAYTVTAACADESLAREYAAWLTGEHVDQVIAGGAHSARVIVLDRAEGEPFHVEARYAFASRAALERYLSEAAPALRAEGLRKFPPEKGLTLSRRVGEIVG